MFLWQHQNQVQTTTMDSGGSRGSRLRRLPPPPQRDPIFHLCIYFCQKVPMSEAGTPPKGVGNPETENPGSATGAPNYFVVTKSNETKYED